jgi:hypothetical protein
MKMKLIIGPPRSLEELWAIEDEFPAVCGPNPVTYAARYGLKLSKRYLKYLDEQKANGKATKTNSRKRKPKPAPARSV